MFTRKKQSGVVLDFDATTDQPTNKFTHWIKTHKKLAIFFAILLVVIVGAGTATALYFINAKQPAPQVSTPVEQPKPAPEPPKYYSPLTGELVKEEAATKQAVTGIMIENSPEARPQSGLKQAGVVFEAIAEGGITRFLALYQQEKPQLIGPVRSVRPYYIDWVAAFNASVAHVGGSAAALTEVRNGSYRDIDQFFNAGTYWRATDRYAPHNVYTSFEKLDALNASKGFTSSTFTGFTRKEATPNQTPTATSISVVMSSALFNSSYTYNSKTNSYDRSQAGAPHTDREEGQLSPRVVIAMKVQESRVFEDGWRESINAIGSGTAYIFQNGTVQEVTWKKTSKTDQITFTSADGKDVPLQPGQTWISAVPDSGGVSWQ